jgi:glycosyltransferase involved in cell wall biosynthesis
MRRRGCANRRLQRVINQYDILISTYNLCNFGRPGIQRVADLSWDEALRRRFDPQPSGMRGWYHRFAWLRQLYLRLCSAIASVPKGYVLSSSDIIVANSQWTAAKLEEFHGIRSRVVYPPVAGHFENNGNERRVGDFVCIGRISPEKRVERMIEIISAVRSRGHDVRLRIVGQIDSSRYAKSISALAARNSNWVVLEGKVVGSAKERLMAECRYGIHGREGEAFGIGVAEMVKAGCITFAPAEGGPAEILTHEALLYHGHEDAVGKIISVLASESLRTELINHLRLQAERFSPQRFMSGLRAAVEEFLQSTAVGSERVDRPLRTHARREEAVAG